MVPQKILLNRLTNAVEISDYPIRIIKIEKSVEFIDGEKNKI